ncbi:TetR/AcrR family transcriptional regulator [Rhodococcus sp. NPDC003318]|uniref:TetR/AcrR family transcriptional regulator n=1 Tax=Rhodococcus sp. NPDC003318 TaxID=3364503 RepID=UPI0036C8ADC4
MSALLAEVDAILTAADDPTLTEVVASGSRDLIRMWLDRKFHQWDEIKPYLTASYEAADEPEVAARTEQWFEDAVGRMVEGLRRAERFPPDRRWIRCVLAFGQLEYLSRRYFVVGWKIPREICLDEITDSWCGLFASEGPG